jgi:hypothetical protein
MGRNKTEIAKMAKESRVFELTIEYTAKRYHKGIDENEISSKIIS